MKTTRAYMVYIFDGCIPLCDTVSYDLVYVHTPLFTSHISEDKKTIMIATNERRMLKMFFRKFKFKTCISITEDTFLKYIVSKNEGLLKMLDECSYFPFIFNVINGNITESYINKILDLELTEYQIYRDCLAKWNKVYVS